MNGMPQPCLVHTRIIALGLSLSCFLVAVRGCVLGATWGSLGSPAFLARVLAASLGDMVYAGAITIIIAGLAWLLRRRRIARACLYALFIFIAIVSLAAAAANIEAVRMIGRPFSYHWLVYADFFLSRDGREAVASSCAPGKLAIAGLLLGAMLLLGVAVRRLGRWMVHRRAGVVALRALAILGVAYFPAAYAHAARIKLPRGQTANPIVTFAASTIGAYRLPPLLTTQSAIPCDDLLTVEERQAKGLPAPAPVPVPHAREQIRNVVFFVFESLGAQYTDPYGAPYGATPNLSACRSRGLLFQNAYAHLPSTNNSLVSMLCSVYPPPNRRSFTCDYNDAPLDSISTILKQRGYRTAFFNAGDLDFAYSGDFIRHHSFDMIQDYRDFTAGEYLKDEERGTTDGVDDVHVMDYVQRWLDDGGSPQKQPFFAVVWTIMTHLPYYPHGEEQRLVDPSDTPGWMLNRYLNALRRSDEALGRLLRFLDEKGLADSTLIVIMGDHGEAFNRHGTYGHAGGIYEENVHIPLLLVHPGLFHGQTDKSVVGMVDVPATILHLMEIPLPPQWQGNSLFDPHHPKRVYFQCPYSDYLVGYREGDLTFMLNGSTGEQEMYDLATDPQQQRNLIDQHPEMAGVIHGRMAGWVQYQTRLIARITGRK